MEFKKKNKWIILSIFASLIVLVGFISWGIYLMDKEDRYGDFYYLIDEVQNEDILVYSTYNNKTEFENFGIVNRSFLNVEIFDNQNTISKSAYDWYDDNSIYSIKLYRPKRLKKNILNINEFEYSDHFELIKQIN